MTFASIIVPAFNAQETLQDTLDALLAQTYGPCEIILVDDGSTDATPQIAASYSHSARFRVLRQTNRGLSGARNSGIAAAHGDVIGFCDADDIWEPEKLARHVAHLEARPEVGVSYAGSAFIDDSGALTGQAQRPQLTGITRATVFKRNPIGNGSAAVIRRAVFESIAFRPVHEQQRDCYFDETFRQSEDIECWMRIALETEWLFEGIPGLLTRYRINGQGLSAATDRQIDAWERMVVKLQSRAPTFFDTHAPAARAYQLRYLCRRAISGLDSRRAWQLARAWLATSRRPFVEEPVKSVVTLAAAVVLRGFGPDVLRRIIALSTSAAASRAVQ
jgi:glycosyltransferase involved in cell wall biosynthesis